MPHILVVEDEPHLNQLLSDYVKASGFECTSLLNGREAHDWLQHHTCDLVLLDLMLPEMGGMEICRELRKTSHIPVIMVTAKIEEIDRLLGLELGADDYICKPYSPREVIARIKAVLRRSSGQEQTKCDSLHINNHTLTARIDDQTIALTAIELRLLELLSHEPGRIFSRQFIMDRIYSDYRVVSDRTVDSHIKKLRKKLKEAAPDKEMIHSIYGAGYKFDIQNHD